MSIQVHEALKPQRDMTTKELLDIIFLQERSTKLLIKANLSE
jgi:hypothetical protein